MNTKTKQSYIDTYIRHIQQALAHLRQSPEATLDLDKVSITVKSYEIEEFSRIRELFGIKSQDLLTEITSPTIVHNDDMNKLSFNTASRTFSVQIISKNEKETLCKAVKSFRELYMQGKPCYLTRYLGLFSVKYGLNTEERYFIVRNCVMGARYPLYRQYDLKGCSVREGQKPCNLGFDDDWEEDNRKLHVFDGMHPIIDSVYETLQVLEKHSIMNYSIRVGICRPKNGKSALERINEKKAIMQASGIVVSETLNLTPIMSDALESKQEVYIIEIVNAIEGWNWEKKFELFVIRLHLEHGRSCAGPFKYRERVCKMIMKSLFIKNCSCLHMLDKLGLKN